MGGFLRRHIATMVVAMVTAAVTAGGPALAHGVQHALFAHDSSKVDGKDAVGAGASLTDRAGKLIATNNSGRLPNNIIMKAPDANRLDGLNSTAFLRSNGKAADADQLDGMDSTEFMTSDDAWAYVVSPGYLHASSGNVQVTHPATGQYCVVVPRRSSHKAAQVTLADPAGTKIVSVGTGHGSVCNPLSTDTADAVPVYIKTTANAAVDANFTIVVPAP